MAQRLKRCLLGRRPSSCDPRRPEVPVSVELVRGKARLIVIAAALGAVVVMLVAPDAADAALRQAAGGSGGSGGFARFVAFLDRLASYTVPVGAAFSVLGLIWG